MGKCLAKTHGWRALFIPLQITHQCYMGHSSQKGVQSKALINTLDYKLSNFLVEMLGMQSKAVISSKLKHQARTAKFSWTTKFPASGYKKGSVLSWNIKYAKQTLPPTDSQLAVPRQVQFFVDKSGVQSKETISSELKHHVCKARLS